MSATLSTHVLDLAAGRPGAGIAVTLFAIDGEQRHELATAVTNADGRTDAPLATALEPGIYELVFAAGAYFRRQGTAAFYEAIPIRVIVAAGIARYHVPLLLAPWGYSTYRGS